MTSLPILLPHGYNPAVTVGDHVTMGQILATAIIQHEEQFIDIAEKFGTTRRKARHLVRKSPGDRLMPGDIIATKKRIFGKKVSLVSDGEGIVKSYERDTGRLVVIRSNAVFLPADASADFQTDTEQSQQIVSPVDGVIAASDGEKIIVETEKEPLMAVHGAGGVVQGELILLDSAHGTDALLTPVTPYELGARLTGKILLGGMFSREDLVKCSSIGVSGIIGATIIRDDISYLLEKKLLLPMVQVDESVWHMLAKRAGKQLFFDADNGTILPL